MLNVHNLMEEQVITRVNMLYDQVMSKNSGWLTCDCENCRLDTVAYVLNRVAPRYVAGGRGITHNANEIKENTQITADLNKLCIEGMKLVNSAKRPYHKTARDNLTIELETETAEFNFPTFIGNIYEGTTFEPMDGASAHLFLDGESAEMMDVTWPNPCQTYTSTNGSYSFWMAPQKAVSEGMKKKFNFTLEITAPGYVPVTSNFTITLESEKIERKELDSTFSMKVKDIFLFKEQDETENN